MDGPEAGRSTASRCQRGSPQRLRVLSDAPVRGWSLGRRLWWSAFSAARLRDCGIHHRPPEDHFPRRPSPSHPGILAEPPAAGRRLGFTHRVSQHDVRDRAELRCLAPLGGPVVTPFPKIGSKAPCFCNQPQKKGALYIYIYVTL